MTILYGTIEVATALLLLYILRFVYWIIVPTARHSRKSRSPATPPSTGWNGHERRRNPRVQVCVAVGTTETIDVYPLPDKDAEA